MTSSRSARHGLLGAVMGLVSLPRLSYAKPPPTPGSLPERDDEPRHHNPRSTGSQHRSRVLLTGAVLLAVVVLAGCGSSGPSAAAAACKQMWTPAASTTGTLTKDKMTQAAGDPDSFTPVTLKDVYGKPLFYERWQWGKTRILFTLDGHAVMAIC